MLTYASIYVLLQFTLFLGTVSILKYEREVVFMWVHLQTDIKLPKEIALNHEKRYQHTRFLQLSFSHMKYI